jgi:hypothetical protein
MGLKKTMQEAVVESRRGKHSLVKGILEEHVTSLNNRKMEFNDIAAHIARYEQFLYEAVAAHNAEVRSSSDRQKKTHELVVAAESELKKIKSKTEELRNHLKLE